MVIECNLRASRSFPFVSKVLKINFIELATKIMLGQKVEKPNKSAFDLDYVGIKASQFSFSRLQKADPVLGVDMASTGEVGCLGDDFYRALLTAMLSVGYTIPKEKTYYFPQDRLNRRPIYWIQQNYFMKKDIIYMQRQDRKSFSKKMAFLQHWFIGRATIKVLAQLNSFKTGRSI